MAFRKLTALSLTDLFVKELERMILSGELKPGDKLEPERQLAREMDVSTAVVNAGISRLEAAGFLKIVPRKGIYIADYLHDGNIITMRELIEYNGRHLDRDVMRAVAETRRSVEIAAARMAAQNRTSENLKRIKDALDAAADPRQKESFPEHAFTFFHEMAIASGNIYLPMIIQTYYPIYVLLYGFYVNLTSQKNMCAPMYVIYDAIEKKDPDSARAGVEQIFTGWEKMLDAME